MNTDNLLLTEDMLARYYDLNKLKKEIESEMSQLKASFHTHMDKYSGPNKKGEFTEGDYRLLRQCSPQSTGPRSPAGPPAPGNSPAAAFRTPGA